MKKLIFWIIIIVIIVGVASLFTGDKEPQVASGEPITIGFIGPLTGDGAVYGEPARDMIALAVDEINAAGGVDGSPLEVIYEDGLCGGQGAANAAQKLINVDKVKVIIGGFCSSESLAAVPIAEQNEVVLFSAGSSSPDLTDISQFFFRNYPSDAAQGEILAEVAYNDKGWGTVGFIMEQLDYPIGVFNSFSGRFEELGGKIIKEEFASETVDFRSQLTKLRGSEIDALFVDVQTPPTADRIFKQMRELDWAPSLLVSDVIPGSKDTVENNKDLLEGALAAEFGVDLSNPKFQDMIEAYKARYGEEPQFQSYAQTEYDAVYMIRDAIAEVGHDAVAIAEWGRNVKDWPGASGLVTIEPSGDRSRGHVAKVILNGKVELLEE